MDTKEFAVQIRVREPGGLPRSSEAIRIGVPLGRGLVSSVQELELLDGKFRTIPHQLRRLAHWPDGSVKWVLVDALATVGAYERSVLTLHRTAPRAGAVTPDSVSELKVSEEAGHVVVDTGAGRFCVCRTELGPLQSVRIGSTEVLAAGACRARLQTEEGKQHSAVIDRLRVEESGRVRASLLLEGGFVRAGRRVPLMFKSRIAFFAGSTHARVEFQVRNPQAARHPGGLWDLGDRGSFRFADLSIRVRPDAPIKHIEWYAENPAEPQHGEYAELSVYQDSSGGKHFDSPNHIDFSGKSTVSFRGYRVTSGAATTRRLIAEGQRAEPFFKISTDAGWVAATIEDFWQNFPKALRVEDHSLSIGLFPTECGSGFELQGGEQKRHVIYLDFGLRNSGTVLPCLQLPLEVSIDPVEVEQSGAIPWFVAAETDSNKAYVSYIANVVEGPSSFFEKREVVDEYGWRNFGDVYADHEAVWRRGSKPMASHYNNQYDFVYGAAVHFLRTGDQRWRQLMEDAARHCIDIDIYHTDQDRAAYNGGLFWHTDHHKEAATSTHRSYSRRNGAAGYGGGPSNEHNYTSGLLHYYYFTGDEEGAAAVLDLAEWVLRMDDGSSSMFALIDTGPTGLASRTAFDDYHGPGRGAGNSINALIDAYRLCGKQRYIEKAEELIVRCIHPADDIASRKLDEPEIRWSYLVFLQVLGKYLELKREWDELDYHFHYARESLLRYADWMVDNETPYKEALHKVEIPTETWPAQDVRKCHILHVAAAFSNSEKRAVLRRRADFFFARCLQDLLAFETALLARPMVILCVYGYIHAFFQRHLEPACIAYSHSYTFGEPVVFRTQHTRLKAELQQRIRVTLKEMKCMLRDRLWRRLW